MKTNFRALTFNGANADFLGKAADLAYQNPDVIKSTLAKWNMKLFQFFDVQSTQAYLAGDDDTFILAFRGTEKEKIIDWMTNADVLQVNGPVGKVHQGFLVGVNYIWRDLWKILDKDRGTRSLWVTGHSLGGALATLAVAKIRFENAHPVNGLYTFGQPRVGDDEFASRFNIDFGAQTFRFVNNQDVVPRVPLRLMNYRDTGTFKYFDKYGKLVKNASWGELLLKRLGDSIEDILNLEDIKDHYMQNYINNLNFLVNPIIPKPR